VIEEYLRGGEGEDAPRTPQNRGGIGLRNSHHRKNWESGRCQGVDDNDDVLSFRTTVPLTEWLHRISAPIAGQPRRVKLMRVGDDAKVISIARVEKDDDPDEEDDEAN
jgi:hypothetical protein